MSRVEIAYSNPTSRMRYGADILFKHCLDIDHAWVEGSNNDCIEIHHDGVALKCPIHAISFSQDEQAILANTKFPCEVLGVCDLNYDPFASAVFKAAQWESVFKGDSLEKDAHNRFIGIECSRPKVELLAQNLAEKLQIPVNLSRYSYMPTIDVDVAYAFKGRTVVHSLLASIRDLVFLRWKNLVCRISVIIGCKNDPYNTYSWIEKLHEDHGLTTKAFFLCSNYSRPYDLGLPQKEIKNLIESLKKWKSNWHPSYKAMNCLSSGDLKGFAEEKNQFPGPTSSIRAHFLRSDARHWSLLVEMGVTDDYSLGFVDQPGFRSGLCRPYPAYDLKADKELPLTIHPVVVMDSTLESYLGLSPNQGVKLVEQLNNEVRNVGGQMVTLFHNSSVSDFGNWEGWKDAYEEIVELCSKPNN